MQSRPLKRVVVCLFRNDLRLSDNPVLTQAAAAARSPCPATCSPLLPVYCFDPRQFSGKKTGRFRARFLADSVLALRAELRSRGSDLLLFCGQPEVVVPALLAAAVPSGSGASSLVVLEHLACHEEAETERALEAALPPPRTKTQTLWGAQTLFEPEDLPFSFPDKVPNGFTSMRKKIESSGADVRDPLPVPNLAGLAPSVPVGAEGVPGYVVAGDATTVGLLGLLGFEADDGVVASPPAALAWRGGERAAVERLEQFCRCGLATYKETRNGSIGPSYSTKMSPWLALGCITPRQIHARVLRFESENGGQTVHTYWVYFELMWRDFFRFYCAKNGRKVWLVGGPLGATGKEWASGERGAELLAAWRAGRTGVPFVDGHMRELLATGFMSNRGRQNVASFLVHNLKVDWRLGAAHFERLLLDYVRPTSSYTSDDTHASTHTAIRGHHRA